MLTISQLTRIRNGNAESGSTDQPGVDGYKNDRSLNRRDLGDVNDVAADAKVLLA